MFLEMLLLTIGDSTVRFASRLTKLENDQEEKLREEIEHLKSQENTDNLEQKKDKNLKKFKVQNYRSIVQNILLNEKPS